MSDEAKPYQLVSRTHINQWVPGLQQTVPGWQITARWLNTGTYLPVFVPDASYTAENVDTLIRLAGANDEAVHALSA